MKELIEMSQNQIKMKNLKKIHSASIKTFRSLKTSKTITTSPLLILNNAFLLIFILKTARFRFKE